MKKVLAFFDLNAPITGRQFLGAGLLLLAIKFLLDHLIAFSLFGVSWSPWDYLSPRWRWLDSAALKNARLVCVMMLVALPFIGAGVALTIKRLRALGWPLIAACVFFIPYVNLLFFLLLITFPSRPGKGRDFVIEAKQESLLAWFGVVMFAVSFGIIAALGLSNYGWGMFVGIPFFIGFFPTLVFKSMANQPLRKCFGTVTLALLTIGAIFLFFAFEGLICLVMATPIVLLVAFLGTSVAYVLRRASRVNASRTEIACCTVIALPTLLGAEYWADREPSLIQVQSKIVVNAPAPAVWTNVIEFSELPEPEEWLFKSGIAYPIRARIEGSGAGAVRYCEFTTGPFIEPIEVWKEPELLRFAVTSNPAPMRELSLFPVEPPHLHGFMTSQAGQFCLRNLPGNRTELEGTTWYQHGLWPERYWQLWSDYIIHKIHMRVLSHIKAESEKPPSF